MAYPPVVIVDKNDQVVGAEMLADAWEQGLRHRLVFVIVEDDAGRILLHRRASSMKLYANRWDMAGGHVDVTPDYEESARIELREETGITDVALTKVAQLYTEDPYDNGTVAKRFIGIYRATYNGIPSGYEEKETAEIRWFTKAQIKQLAQEQPDSIADGLYRCLPYILESS